ncbi:hypothetical protein N0V87_008735 [Didymella glomerata]|uniref:Uncharacterized protein n=1 Tax=Didymella glomerata TaxID=749621 RepID=A0A9W8WSH9_9PLEO|nr:hypothetical protein N0V87_008735 [Didymella glomerata]
MSLAKPGASSKAAPKANPAIGASSERTAVLTNCKKLYEYRKERAAVEAEIKALEDDMKKYNDPEAQFYTGLDVLQKWVNVIRICDITKPKLELWFQIAQNFVDTLSEDTKKDAGFAESNAKAIAIKDEFGDLEEYKQVFGECEPLVDG